MNFPQTQKLSPYFRAGAKPRVNLAQKFDQLSVQESLDLLNRKEDKLSTDICLNLLEKCRKKKDRIPLFVIMEWKTISLLGIILYQFWQNAGM